MKKLCQNDEILPNLVILQWRNPLEFVDTPTFPRISLLLTENINVCIRYADHCFKLERLRGF